MRSRALEMLRRIAGPAAHFRPGQWESIEAVVTDRRRALVVQRTGWGKSAVYFIATALLREQGMGPTVIVSPLLVLMRNQIEMAERLGLVARTVNSTNRDDWDEVFAAIGAGEVDLLLISPERLNNPVFRQDVLPELLRSLGLLVVDEVHCISDWGHDFRPDYRRLSRIVGLLPPNVAVLGTTATANDRVVADVAEQLGADLLVVRGTLERESLRLQVVDLPNAAARMAWLAQTIPTFEGSGIVYCLTVRDANRVGAWLVSRGIEARTYTGDAESDDRLEIEELLTAGHLKVVVATSALGMGYDNPHIRFVVHYQAPGSPVAYYQQVGRAGRAVDSALGVLLTGAEDRDIQDYFITTAFPTREQVTEVLDALAASDGLKMRQLETVNLAYGRLAATLKVLEVEGAVYRDGTTWHRSASAWEYPTERVEAVTAHRRREQEVMVEYGTTQSCLMEMLRRQLDDPEAVPCGRCANCVGSLVDVGIDDDVVQAAIEFTRDRPNLIEPRHRWPFPIEGSTKVVNPVEPGRVLTRWGDPGLAKLVEMGKYRDRRFADELVVALVSVIEEWPLSAPPEWVTSVPARDGLLEDLARRLAAELGLEYVPAIHKARTTRPQKEMQNSTQQTRNLLGAFRVDNPRSGPVLLVDDMVDSRWTLTIVGDLLRAAGSGPVYPVALADTSREWLVKLSDDAMAVVVSSTRLGNSSRPSLPPKMWHDFQRALADAGLTPEAVFKGSATLGAAGIASETLQRVEALVAESAAVAIDLEHLANKGIWVSTIVDDDYPARLRELGHRAPPTIFGVGERSLLGLGGIGLVGSRDVAEAGAALASQIASEAARRGMPVVSGGARGVDQIAMNAAYSAGGSVVGVLADSLEQRIKNPDIRRALEAGTTTLITQQRPDTGFSPASAMARNKIVYSLATLTVVIASAEKGGTWTGACEALDHSLGRVAVWRGEGEGEGNQRLQARGATPLTSPAEAWELMLQDPAVDPQQLEIDLVG